MTQKNLERLTRLWQKRLRLQDWKVTIQLKPEEEMRKRELYGFSTHQPSEQEAIVEVANDSQAERTLVHELLHLRLAPFSGILREQKFKLNEEDKAAQETAINLLADCFIQAWGETKGRK